MKARALIATLALLAGCASVESDWHYAGNFHPTSLRIVRGPVEGICGPNTNGCYRMEGIGKAVIYLGPRADNCTLVHELWHFAGWAHKGPVGDCGVVYPENVAKKPPLTPTLTAIGAPR